MPDGPAAASSELLTVEGLDVEFSGPDGATQVLFGVGFDVGTAESVGLIGETGSGKSVTVRSVLGILRPPGRRSAGRVLFGGRELTAMSEAEVRRIRGAEIGFVPQDPAGALDPFRTVGRQLSALARAHTRLSRRGVREASRRALQDAGLVDVDRVLGSYPHQLSGGMAQRVAIGLAVVLRPQLVMADEPTTGLDVTVQRQVLDTLGHRVRADGLALLLVTHDLGVVAEYCDRVVVMYAGTVVEAGPVASVFRAPEHPYTRALLSAASVLEEGRVADTPAGAQSRRRADPRRAAGCPFAARCPQRLSVCDSVKPVAVDLDGGVSVRCHLFTSRNGDGAAA